MSDPLADRLKHLTEQYEKGKQAEQNAKSFQDRVNQYISDNAQGEYQRLLQLLKERVDKVNPTLGSLPQYVVGQQQVQQGHVAAYFTFDKPITNLPNNALIVSIGYGPNTAMMLGIFGPPPAPVRFRMQAAAADDFSRIVWTGDLGEIKSEQLVDVALEQLTTYYFKHKE